MKHNLSYFVEDVTDATSCGYDILLTIYEEDSVTETGSYKAVFKKVYGFDHKADTWIVEQLAKDILKLTEDI